MKTGKEFTYADALNEVNVLIDFVNEKGMKMTFEEFDKIMESVNLINMKVHYSSVIDDYIKDKFNNLVCDFVHYIGKGGGVQSLLLHLEIGLGALVK